MADQRDIYDDQDDENEEKSAKSSEFAQLLEDSFKTTRKGLTPGEKIRAEILSVGKEDIFVSTGMMHDGVVSRRDLLDKEGNFNHKVGDKLDLYVIQARGTDIRLSPSKTAKNIADDLEDAYEKRVPVEGKVAEVCNGGFRVQIKGKLAFCPISQMDTKRIEVPEEYIGRKGEFRITQISEGGRNVVVSRRKVLEEQQKASASTFGDDHKPGDVMKGTVTRLEKFGAFVEIAPGIDGLVHISEISYTRLETAQEALAIGQEVNVKLLKTEEVDGRLKISLSIRQVGPEPWDNLPAQIKEGQTAEGRVTRLMKFGAFVELAPGIEGLIPLSEMSHTKRVMTADEIVKPNERVQVMIKEIRASEHRISLSLKDAGENPWALVAHKFPVGSLVKGKVQRREAFGLFVELEDGIVGLLPKSKALEDNAFPYDKLKPGAEVSLRIAELRLDERRISFTLPGDESSDDWKSHTPAASGSFGTLGDKLKLAMEPKKKK
jgi:small subunit ribosomal protein S1